MMLTVVRSIEYDNAFLKTMMMINAGMAVIVCALAFVAYNIFMTWVKRVNAELTRINAHLYKMDTDLGIVKTKIKILARGTQTNIGD